MNVLEQIGRYGSMFLMVFNIGIAEFGFASTNAFLIYFLGSILFMLTYWIMWIIFFVNPSMWNRMALAIIPTLLFLLCGCTLGHILLIITAIIFGIGHIYVTLSWRKEYCGVFEYDYEGIKYYFIDIS